MKNESHLLKLLLLYLKQPNTLQDWMIINNLSLKTNYKIFKDVITNKMQAFPFKSYLLLSSLYPTY